MFAKAALLAEKGIALIALLHASNMNQYWSTPTKSTGS
jgi:hypothetical protein